MAATKENAAKQVRNIVCVEEPGPSERVTRIRTRAPRSETPALQHHFNWHHLSAMAGIIWRPFYFRLFRGAVKGPQVVEFLYALHRQRRGPLLIIWDGLPAHRSRLASEYVESQDGAIQLKCSPAYAPELNPVEYIWSYLKGHEVVHFCPRDFSELRIFARGRLASMQRRSQLVAGFWKQAKLAL